MAIAQGGATGGTTKSSAVDNYWKNYSKYNTPATVTKKATTPKKATVTKKTIIPTTTKTPTTQATTPKSTTPIVATNDRDIGTEIAAELAKGNVDWNKLSGLASERNSKITSNNITGVESTEDMINRLYGQQGSSDSATPTIAGTAETAPANLIAGTPAIVATKAVVPEIAPEVDAREYIDQLLAAKRESQYAALEAAKTRALTGLDTSKTGKQTALDTAKNNYLTNLDTSLQSSMENIGNEEAKIDPYYYDLRNQAQASSDVGAMNFAQYMAGRGIKGGAGAMPEIYRNAGLQGQIGGLNRQQAANQSEIERMRTTTQGQYDTNRTNVLNNYETDLAGLESEYLTSKQGMLDAYDQDRLATQSGLDAKGLQAYIDQMNADRLFSLNEAGITGKYGGTPTLAGQEFQQKLDDKGKAGYLDTIGRFSDNYQQEINNVQNDNDTTNDWQIAYLQSARQQKLQTQAEQTAAAAAAASETERQQYLDALNEWELAGEASDRVASILGIDPGDRTADYDIDKINAATSQQNANTAAKNANTAQTKTETPKPDDSYSGYMSKAIGLMNSDSSPEQIIAYIKSLPISAEQKAQMANDLGL